MLRLDPLQRRRWAAFRANRRALWSLRIFLLLLLVTLPAEFVANDRPILVMYRGELFVPVLRFYPETAFGGEFETEADYRDPAVRCLIRTGGLEACLDDPGGTEADAADGEVAGQPVRRGWLVFPPVPYSFDTVNNVARAPSPPDSRHWLGTDDQTRDVLARVIHGFRISILFAAVVTAISSLMGIAAGAVQGYFGGLLDLFFQRVVEIWNATPALYILIIMGAIFTMNFWLLTLLLAVFGWTALVGVVRAEFLRARNFEYVRAARALGVPDAGDHVPPPFAQCDGGDADHAALPGHLGDRHPRRARLPGLRAAAILPLSGRADPAGQEQSAGALAGLHRLRHLHGDAVDPGVHLRGGCATPSTRARCFGEPAVGPRPVGDLRPGRRGNPGGARRFLRHRPGRDGRAGGRIGLGQVGHRAVDRRAAGRIGPGVGLDPPSRARACRRPRGRAAPDPWQRDQLRLPGADDEPESAAHHRASDRREPRAASGPDRGRGTGANRHALAPGGDPRPRIAAVGLSPPAFGADSASG
ncbi:MAG: hypothetical protein KatS3mg118_0300 [Paracoccaceae bacterium]|nr:MAG: hypothetical protein KatS3mg118_0300 [Paracoccaceae bacterium]